jgi:hypothetical protein
MSMFRRLSYVVMLLFASISVFPTSGSAQSSDARLQGSVLDSSGTAIPKCRLSAVHKATQARYDVEADEGGLFLFSSLAPGEYTVTAQAPGFRTEVRIKVLLHPGTTVSERFRLEAGKPGEPVVTEARAVGLESHNSRISGYVGSRDIEMLPLLERQPVHLAAYQPGVQVEGGNESFSRVNGTRQGSNNLKIDGLDANDPLSPRLGFSAVAINGDSVDCFRVVTSGGEAEFGRSAGAQIQLNTRSGGNRWSGNAFEYFRNKRFNANDFFSNSSDVERPDFNQNLFGLSAGGPLLEGKTFMFANYQGRRTARF